MPGSILRALARAAPSLARAEGGAGGFVVFGAPGAIVGGAVGFVAGLVGDEDDKPQIPDSALQAVLEKLLACV